MMNKNNSIKKELITNLQYLVECSSTTQIALCYTREIVQFEKQYTPAQYKAVNMYIYIYSHIKFISEKRINICKRG